MYSVFRRISVIALCGLLAACGFQLRGQAQLPDALDVTYITGTMNPNAPPSPLARALRTALEANGVTVTEDPAAASATVAILGESLNRRVLATGPEGEMREYTFTYTVDYAVTATKGTAFIPKDTLTISRDVLYDEADVLGRTAGEDIALREMVSDAAYAIIRRLQAVAS